MKVRGKGLLVAHTKGVPLDLQLEALELGRLGCELADVLLDFFVDGREVLAGGNISLLMTGGSAIDLTATAYESTCFSSNFCDLSFLLAVFAICEASASALVGFASALAGRPRDGHGRLEDPLTLKETAFTCRPLLIIRRLAFVVTEPALLRASGSAPFRRREPRHHP